MAKNEEGRWITIGAVESEAGKRHGGSPVFIQGDRIIKGAPGLTGRHIGNMNGEAEHGTHRQQLHQDKHYQAARWHQKARAAGINPKDLEALKDDLTRHDAAHVQERRQLLRDARQTLKNKGYHAGALTTNLRSGRVENKIPHLDELVEEMQRRYPAQFAGHHDAEARLLDLFSEGNPQPMSEDNAYEHALQNLQEHGSHGSETSGEPWFDDDESEPIPFSRNRREVYMRRNTLDAWAKRAPSLQYARQRTSPANNPKAAVSLDSLTPQQLHRRADAALHFSRQIGGDFMDSFHTGEQLTDLLGNADPEAVENAIDEARRAVRDGRLSPDRAVERLLAQFGTAAVGEDSRLLAAAFRRCLSDEQPFAKVFALMKEEQGEIPDSREREAMAYCRQQHAQQYARAFGVEMPPEEFVPDGELDRAVKLMDRRTGLSFDRALEMVRTGR